MSDDPTLNPWLRSVTAFGRDEYGQPKTETIPHLRPELYFWLGKDAERTVVYVDISDRSTWPWPGYFAS